MTRLTSTIFLIVVTISATVTGNNTTTFSLPTEFLSSHNAIRSPLKLPPLTWDPMLTRYAESYALRRRTDCILVHSGGPYGENIFWGSGSGWRPAQAVAAWGGEGRWYSIKPNTCVAGQQCGHYTQIIWRATRRMGCATINCGRGRGQLMVCEYDPPGNYIGERPY